MPRRPSLFPWPPSGGSDEPGPTMARAGQPSSRYSTARRCSASASSSRWRGSCRALRQPIEHPGFIPGRPYLLNRVPVYGHAVRCSADGDVAIALHSTMSILEMNGIHGFAANGSCLAYGVAVSAPMTRTHPVKTEVARRSTNLGWDIWQVGKRSWPSSLRRTAKRSTQAQQTIMPRLIGVPGVTNMSIWDNVIGRCRCRLILRSRTARASHSTRSSRRRGEAVWSSPL